MAYHLFHLSTLLSVSDEDQQHLGNTHHWKRQSGTDGKSGTADHGIFTSITKCAFDQVNDISVSLIVRSDHFITVLAEEAGRPPKETNIQWFLASSKTVKAVCLINSCLWALLVTADASLYILPVLPLISQSWNKKFSSASSSPPKYSATDITMILLENQKHTKPTSLVCWRSRLTNSDVGIVGTEDGEVVFVDLQAKQEKMRVRIGDAVMSLELVHHGKSVTYLLISTVSNNQFGLLLEQNNSTAGSLTNSLASEASNLEYTLVKSSDALNSILRPEVNDPMFRPLRFDQFLRTVQLSTQVVKGNCLIIAHCLCSNILKVYDSSLDSWLTLFVYSIPISSDKVLLTDHFIFALTKANKLQHTTITVLSSKLSETSGYEHHHSSDAKMQKLLLPAGEHIIGIYKQLFPTVTGKTADVSTSDEETENVNSSRSEADRNNDERERKGSSSSHSFVDGCIIFTNKAVYQVKPRLNFEDFFLSLIDEGSNKQAENLGMTLDLNMSSLYLRAAEHRLQQREVQEAIKLFRLSRSSLTVQALLLAKHNFLQEALSVIENALGKQGDVSHSDCRKLANIAVKCLICLLHKSKNKKENVRHLQTFLADNFDYDEVAAVRLLGEHSLWDAMLEMARTRGHVMVAMETILDKCSLPMSSSLFKKLKSSAFIHAFVSARNGAFMQKLSTRDAIDILMSKVDLLFRHLTFIEQSLPSLTVPQLLQLAVVLDPTKAKMRVVFETRRGRSLSSSSITSLDSLGSLDFWSEDALLPDAIVLVKSFIFVLIELHWRRLQEGYNISLEPMLRDIDRDYVVTRNTGEEHVYVNEYSGVQRNLIACGRHHAGLISSGELYTWGSATHGRLGHGSIIPVNGSSPPLRVETLHMHHQQVIAISCGNKHTLVLTSTDKVYAWGSSAYGQVGTGDRKIRTHPTLVEEMQGRGCVEIVCGQYHCLARTQGNRVWSWGWGVHGQLGHGDIEDQLVPKPIASLLDKDIVSIGAGACHSGVLSSDGKVWMFGSGAFGQLGSDEISKSSLPVLLCHLADEPVKTLACGYYHNVAVVDSESEKLYVWGKSPFEIRMVLQVTRKLRAQTRKSKKASQVGVQDADRHYMKPGLVATEHLTSPIKKIVCACTHSILLTESGQVFTWGRNDSDQLGNPSNHKKFIPKPLPILERQIFADIGAGLDFTMAVNHYGGVFSWGAADSDQLGYCVNRHFLLPPNTSSTTVVSPRKVPNIPLITIPAEMLCSHRGRSISEEIEEEGNISQDRFITSPKTVIDKLLADLPTSSLALPSLNDPDQAPYSQLSLNAVLNHLRDYYHVSEVVKCCRDHGLWSMAAEVHLIEKDFENALLCNFELLKNEQRPDILEKTMSCVDSFLSLLSQTLEVKRNDLQQRPLQVILMKIFAFWLEQDLKISDLESLIKMYMSFLAYPLSVLLFSPKSNRGEDLEPGDTLLLNNLRKSFSTSFCLEVTSVSVGIIQGGKFSANSNLSRGKKSFEGMPASGKLTSPWHMNAMAPPKILTAEFLQHSGHYSREGMIMTSEALTQGPGTRDSPETGGTESKKVVFTCGHFFSKSSFLREEVSKIEDRLASFPSKVSKSVDIIRALYETESKVIPAACPQCVLDSLIQVTK